MSHHPEGNTEGTCPEGVTETCICRMCAVVCMHMRVGVR